MDSAQNFANSFHRELASIVLRLLYKLKRKEHLQLFYEAQSTPREKLDKSLNQKKRIIGQSLNHFRSKPNSKTHPNDHTP